MDMGVCKEIHITVGNGDSIGHGWKETIRKMIKLRKKKLKGDQSQDQNRNRAKRKYRLLVRKTEEFDIYILSLIYANEISSSKNGKFDKIFHLLAIKQLC